jgi:hypothetical protein
VDACAVGRGQGSLTASAGRRAEDCDARGGQGRQSGGVVVWPILPWMSAVEANWLRHEQAWTCDGNSRVHFGKPGRITKILLAVAVGMSTATVIAHGMCPCRTGAGRGDPRDQKREGRSYKQEIPHHKLPLLPPNRGAKAVTDAISTCNHSLPQNHVRSS